MQDNRDADNVTEFYSGARRQTGNLILSGLVLAIYAWYLIGMASVGTLPVLLWVSALIIVPLALTMFILALRHALKPQMVLRLDNEGITDCSIPGVAFGVTWAEVEDILYYKIGRRQEMLGIRVFHPKDALRRLSALKRIMYKINQTSMALLINIPQELFELPVEEIVKVIKEYKCRADAIEE